jgi:hypothetical protein
MPVIMFGRSGSDKQHTYMCELVADKKFGSNDEIVCNLFLSTDKKHKPVSYLSKFSQFVLSIIISVQIGWLTKR